MTIPLLLALVIVHFALVLPSAAFPDQLQDCKEGIEDCFGGGKLAKDVQAAADSSTPAAEGGGLFGFVKETAEVVLGAVKQVWHALDVVKTIFTFDYKILDASSYTGSDDAGTGIMGTMMMGLRTMLGIAQLVIGVRILLALRGSGGL